MYHVLERKQVCHVRSLLWWHGERLFLDPRADSRWVFFNNASLKQTNVYSTLTYTSRMFLAIVCCGIHSKPSKIDFHYRNLSVSRLTSHPHFSFHSSCINNLAINMVGEKYPGGSKIDAITWSTSRLVDALFCLTFEQIGTAIVSLSQFQIMPKPSKLHLRFCNFLEQTQKIS